VEYLILHQDVIFQQSVEDKVIRRADIMHRQLLAEELMSLVDNILLLAADTETLLQIMQQRLAEGTVTCRLDPIQPSAEDFVISLTHSVQQ
jgi:hypothetical protein